MIRHTVSFRLKHPRGSAAELAFLQAVRELVKIPGVERFECLRQTSPKSDYAFGLSMEFATPAAYEGYNRHPDHVSLVQQRWIPEVEKYIELDYEPFGR